MNAPKPFSPAAQAVLDAATLPCTIREGIAAAIRALADQVVPAQLGLMHPVAQAEAENIRAEILAIAAELEGSNA